MAEVIEILHKLTYEADTSGLDTAYAALQPNIKSIADLSTSIQKLEQLKASTDKGSIDRIKSFRPLDNLFLD